jgi:hypothetical protein
VPAVASAYCASLSSLIVCRPPCEPSSPSTSGRRVAPKPSRPGSIPATRRPRLRLSQSASRRPRQSKQPASRLHANRTCRQHHRAQRERPPLNWPTSMSTVGHCRGQVYPRASHLHETLTAGNYDPRPHGLSISRPERVVSTPRPQIRPAHMQEPRGLAEWKVACVGNRRSPLKRRDKSI